MKFTRVFHRRLRDCSEILTEQFRALSFGYSGQMCRWLDEMSKHSYVFYIYDADRRVAAWAMCQDSEYREEIPIGFYTNKNYRRMGLASRLARYINKYHKKLFNKKIRYYPHDDISTNFFRKCWAEKNFNAAHIIDYEQSH